MSKELNEEQRKKLSGGSGSYLSPTGQFCELKASANGGFCGRQSSGMYDCTGCPSQGKDVEGGVLVGASVAGKKVWIIDDVITAGTAIREVVTILKNAGATIAGVLVALDRQEKGQGNLSAIQEVQQELEIPVHALINMKDLMDYLDAKGDQEALAKMEAYRLKYGI